MGLTKSVLDLGQDDADLVCSLIFEEYQKRRRVWDGGAKLLTS